MTLLRLVTLNDPVTRTTGTTSALDEQILVTMSAKSSKLISLNEAATWIMDEERRTPEQELDRFGLLIRELENRASACQQVWPMFRAGFSQGALISLPEKVPSWPPALVVELLGSPHESWPDPIRTLVHVAQEYHRRASSYLKAHRQAVQFLIQQSRCETISMFGRRHPRTRHELISIDNLNLQYALESTLRHLIVDQMAQAPKQLRCAESQESPQFFDVQVLEEEVAWLVGNLDAQPGRDPAERRKYSDEELLEWILHPHQKRFRDLHGPAGHREQEVELKEQFKGLLNVRQRLIDLNAIAQFRHPQGRRRRE